MRIEKKRLMKILYYLIETKGVVTAKEIANYADVSERTIKNDLIEVEELAKASGCELLAKKGVGYWIEIRNLEVFKEIEENLYFTFSNNNYTKEYEDRANRIVRLLLIQNSYVKLDDIAEELYLSKSSIKGVMKEVREILADFNLSLKIKPRYGIKVDGIELNIRYCMLELLIDHDIRALPLIDLAEYNSYFQLVDIDIADFRHNFLKTLRTSGTRIVDNNTHRIVRYLILLFNRFKQGFYISLPDEDVELLESIGEYKTAKDILKNLSTCFPCLKYNNSEILGLEILLLMWNDLNEEDLLEERYPLFYDKCDWLANKIFNRITKKWNVDLEQLPGLKRTLIAGLIPNFVRIHFDYIGYNRIIGKKVENNMMSSTPLCIALALDVSDVINEEFGIKISLADLFNYAVRFYISISKIEYNYLPRRVLISAQSGIQSCSIIRDKIVRKFGMKFFDCLDVINSYEVRRLDQSKYDYMILNFAPHYYRYDLPFIYVDSIPNEVQLNQIYYQIVLSGYEIRKLQERMNFNKDFIFRSFKYNSRKEFLYLCSYKYCKDNGQIESFYNHLLKFGDFCVWNETAFIIVNSINIKENNFDIYILEKTEVWVRKNIKNIIFVSVDFQEDLQLVKFINQLSHVIIYDNNRIDDLVSGKSMNQFVEIIKHGLLSE